MGFLILCTPSSNNIAKMGAFVLYLGVIAHVPEDEGPIDKAVCRWSNDK